MFVTKSEEVRAVFRKNSLWAILSHQLACAENICLQFKKENCGNFQLRYIHADQLRSILEKNEVKVFADMCFWRLLFSGFPGMLSHQLFS